MAQSVVKRGSVVLICYPFTDLSGAKVREAVCRWWLDGDVWQSTSK